MMWDFDPRPMLWFIGIASAISGVVAWQMLAFLVRHLSLGWV